MMKELKGKVKQKVWLRPVCTDESDSFRAGQAARRDFRQDARRERRLLCVIAPDVLTEAEEFCPNENPFFSEESESYEV